MSQEKILEDELRKKELELEQLQSDIDRVRAFKVFSQQPNGSYAQDIGEIKEFVQKAIDEQGSA